MPEGKEVFSGGQPEKKNIGGPTVMPSGHPTRQPTRLGGQGVTLKPTRMSGQVQVAPQPMVKPTTLTPSAFTKPVTPRVEIAPPVTGPSVFGKKRERIPVTLPDLQKKNGQTEIPVLEEALRLIQVFNADTAKDEDGIYWGTQVQQEHSRLVSEGLALVQSEVVTRTMRSFNRIALLLRQIRLEKVFGPGGSGLLSRMIRKHTSEIDTPAELEEAQQEIAHLVQLMDRDIAELVAFKGKIESNLSALKVTHGKVEAAAIAAQYLAEYLVSKSRQSLAQRFSDRGMSLMTSFGQMMSGMVVGQGQVQDVLSLISVVQNTVLVTVPIMLSSIAAMQMVVKRDKQPTVTEVNELGDQLKNLIKSIG